MKSTGIVRKVDELGRVVLPIELRRMMEIKEKDPLEVYVEGDKVILANYQPSEERENVRNKLEWLSKNAANAEQRQAFDEIISYVSK
ncbi:looped-hinge helix DNA binding domain-containing protein, AbrB family [Thalassobacillus cyri]|uniref:Looped-hinge helix DNA binding domain-containing protein, AbrB family n=1 Tax=Thalassobacillus cyri TaxID=571932 RepID=A0A1H4H2I4_9BACI|nr:AbrB/MazE/SpoVT family DNA-binding domain-containing protein [Thalassobacillus cyri]SEB15974.1 looped-hinge helix DNA binding domain-containing protein, AbrB family [Thalassobacillus cyri]